LFPSTHHAKPITPAALTCALVRHRKTLGIGDTTVHDLRRTMATWLGELGIAPDLIGALLNHSKKGITGQVYNQATMLDARRQAMERWSAWLERVIAGDSVEEHAIPISRARREHRPKR
jgi:integrase